MKYIILDFETTGLNKSAICENNKQPYIVQVGLLVIEKKEITKEFSVLIKPEIPIPQDVITVHGITDKHVEKAKPFRNYIPKIQHYFMHADAVIGQNIIFDINVLFHNLYRCGMHTRFPFAPIILDTKTECERRHGESGNLAYIHKLVTGEYMKNAHDALSDCKAVYNICKAWKIFK